MSLRKSKLHLGYKQAGRKERGSILPFVAIGMPLTIALVAFAIDLTRNIETVRKLEFAADAAAEYAGSFMTNADGSFNAGTARANMLAALNDVNGNPTAWNTAPSAMVVSSGQNERTPVTFSDADLALVPNPSDGQELFVQVTAHRTGNEALQPLFAPAIKAFAALTGSAVNVDSTASPTRLSEVIAQPAARVGAAAPRPSDPGVRSLAPFAVFPLALSNQQFAAAAAPTNANTLFTADLVTASGAAQAAAANHLKAAFVNVAASPSSGQTYGDAQGNLAIDQLVGMFDYFSGQQNTNAVLPAAVERGVTVKAFNPLDATYVARRQSIINALLKMPSGQWLILPVVSGDPSFSQPNQVVGFARMQLLQPVSAAATSAADMSIQLRIGESIPLRNVATSNFVTVPSYTGQILPAPVAPFAPRAFDPATNTIAARPRGVVMVATISPRKVSP